MITDFDPPIKKLAEEFVPHSKLLLSAVMSLWPVYFSRNLPVEKWRYSQLMMLLRVCYID